MQKKGPLPEASPLILNFPAPEPQKPHLYSLLSMRSLEFGIWSQQYKRDMASPEQAVFPEVSHSGGQPLAHTIVLTEMILLREP